MQAGFMWFFTSDRLADIPAAVVIKRCDLRYLSGDVQNPADQAGGRRLSQTAAFQLRQKGKEVKPEERGKRKRLWRSRRKQRRFYERRCGSQRPATPTASHFSALLCSFLRLTHCLRLASEKTLLFSEMAWLSAKRAFLGWHLSWCIDFWRDNNRFGR